VSISTTFYAQPYCMKVFFECRWNWLGVNFINIFTYKFFVRTSFQQLFLIKFWLWWKICTKNASLKRWWNRRQDYKRQPKESHISVVFGWIPKERFSICFILFEKAEMMFLWSTRSIKKNIQLKGMQSQKPISRFVIRQLHVKRITVKLAYNDISIVLNVLNVTC